MEIKNNPQGYLIYAAMGAYLMGCLSAWVTAVVRFRKIMTAMVRRAKVFFFWACILASVVALILAKVKWARQDVFPTKSLLKALLIIPAVYLCVRVIGLIAKALASKFSKLHSTDSKRLRLVTHYLETICTVFVSIALIIVVAAFAYRWYNVRHVPMQNLFEVFLTLGVLTIPISMMSRWFLGIRSLATDLLLGAVVLLPAGFVFSDSPQQLPPALQSWLFAPHVAVYMLSYLFMAKAFLQAVFQMWTRDLVDDNLQYEQATYWMVYAGFPLLTLGLILGSYWGKLAWGDYWAWDPKELWSLVSWLAFLVYFHFRYMFGKKHANVNSVLAILGMVAIVITLLWVNLSKLFPGQHSYA